MDILPRIAINKIMFFLSHPVADIFKIELEEAHKRMKEENETRNTMITQLETERQLTGIGERCDCCMSLLTECICMCSNCYGNYSICRYSCYDTRLMLSS